MTNDKNNKIKLSLDPGSAIRNKTFGWRTNKPVFDYSKCIKCRLCEQICPEGVCFFNVEKNSYDADLDYCKGCGLCAKHCPANVIKMELEER